MKKLLNMMSLVLTIAFITTFLAACGSGGGGVGGVGTNTASAYIVTYNGNGDTSGIVPVDTTNYQEGNTITALGNPGNLVDTNFTFNGWNTSEAGTGTTYTQGQIFTMGTASVTLYAKWISNSIPTYTVVFNNNGATGGSVPIDSTNYVHGQAVAVIANTGSLVNTGYSFAGWNSRRMAPERPIHRVRRSRWVRQISPCTPNGQQAPRTLLPITATAIPAVVSRSIQPITSRAKPSQCLAIQATSYYLDILFLDGAYKRMGPARPTRKAKPSRWVRRMLPCMRGGTQTPHRHPGL